MKNRFVAFGLMVATAVAGLAPTAAMAANENTAKNVAIGATALSAYLLLHRSTRTAGVVGAAGSAYLWKKYSDDRKVRRRHEIARENYYRRAAYHNAQVAQYYRSRYYSARSSSPRRSVARRYSTRRTARRTTTYRRYARRY